MVAERGRTTMRKRWWRRGLVFGGVIILQNTWDCDLTAHLATIRRLAEHPHDGLFPGHLAFSVSDGARHVRTALAAMERGAIPPTL